MGHVTDGTQASLMIQLRLITLLHYENKADTSVVLHRATALYYLPEMGIMTSTGHLHAVFVLLSH